MSDPSRFQVDYSHPYQAFYQQDRNRDGYPLNNSEPTKHHGGSSPRELVMNAVPRAELEYFYANQNEEENGWEEQKKRKGRPKVKPSLPPMTYEN